MWIILKYSILYTFIYMCLLKYRYIHTLFLNFTFFNFKILILSLPPSLSHPPTCTHTHTNILKVISNSILLFLYYYYYFNPPIILLYYPYYNYVLTQLDFTSISLLHVSWTQCQPVLISILLHSYLFKPIHITVNVSPNINHHYPTHYDHT